MPEEWPPLFGPPSKAYSLRYFWGIFWHKLHVAIFTALMPSYLRNLQSREISRVNQRIRRIARIVVGSLKALWIFSLSGIGHIVVDLATTGNGNSTAQLRFFLLNFILCLIETVLLNILRERCQKSGRLSIWVIFGYGWVFIIFFCLVPGWIYPVIYTRTTSLSKS